MSGIDYSDNKVEIRRLFLFFRHYLFILFLDREEGKEKERERNVNVWLPLVCPLLGAWPATQACALTGNQTGYTLVLRPVLHSLSHTSQGWRLSFMIHLMNIFNEFLEFWFIEDVSAVSVPNRVFLSPASGFC